MTVVLLLYGGASYEHRISCISACYIFDALVKASYQVVPVYIKEDHTWHLQEQVCIKPEQHQKKLCYLDTRKNLSLRINDNRLLQFDIAFPMIHGQYGEDGTIQGMFEALRIPYVGCGLSTSTLCMNKYLTKCMLNMVNIPYVHFLHYHVSDMTHHFQNIYDTVQTKFKLPVFVKACNMGSSIGITRVDHMQDLYTAMEDAFNYDCHVLIEASIDCREIEVGIMGNYPDYNITTMGEVTYEANYYSFDTKYNHSGTSQLHIPADINNTLQKQIQLFAKQAFSSVQGNGLARVDFFLSHKTGKLYLNEINTMPGFTEISMFPKLWLYEGYNEAQLVTQLVNLGLQKFEKNLQIKMKS